MTFREFVAKQRLFNRYTLIKALGRGGMGVVCLARDDELERAVALKFLPELIIHDRGVLSDLKRETRRSERSFPDRQRTGRHVLVRLEYSRPSGHWQGVGHVEAIERVPVCSWCLVINE